MWKHIKNWENYSINEYGKIINNISGHIIVGDINNAGYYRVCLYQNGKHKKFFRHRLVAEHFLDNSNCYKEVNHIDGDKSNNYYKNLEWCTKSQNEQHAWQHKLKKYNKGIIANKPFIVHYINGVQKEYQSQKYLSKELRISQGLVSKWLNNKSKSYNKYNIKSIKFINV